MNFGRVIVEGLTDAYFIHQLICVRFGKALDPIYDSDGGFRYPVDKDAQDEVFRFAKKGKKDVILEIVINGGSSKLDVLSGLLRDESGATRTMLPCIIFDADYPKSGKCDAKGNGGYSNALSTFSAAAPGVPLYFFPNNQDNGTIETLLKSIAIGQSAYFEECWPAFVGKLRFYRPKRELSSKTELANYVESYGRRIGDRKCYLQNLANAELWDYNAQSLDKLADFLSKLINQL